MLKNVQIMPAGKSEKKRGPKKMSLTEPHDSGEIELNDEALIEARKN